MLSVVRITLLCCIAGYLLYEFDKFWFAEKPRDIMEFNRVKEKYRKKIVHSMKDKRAFLSTNFVTDTRTDTLRSVPSMPIWWNLCVCETICIWQISEYETTPVTG